MRWFCHVERKGDADWIKCCTTMDVDGISQRGWSRKTWWDGRQDMKRFGLYQEDALERNRWRRKVMVQLANTDSPGKWLLKYRVCLCAFDIETIVKLLELIVVVAAQQNILLLQLTTSISALNTTLTMMMMMMMMMVMMMM